MHPARLHAGEDGARRGAAEGEVEKAHDVGVETGAVHVDLPAIIRRKRALVDYFAADRMHDLESYPLVRGDARFVAPDAIVADGRRIVADRFVIATGASIVPPPIDGLDDVPTMTSTGVLEMTHAPRTHRDPRRRADRLRVRAVLRAARHAA